MTEGLFTGADVQCTIQNFLDLADEMNFETAVQQIRAEYEARANANFQLLVVGEEKTGKSHLINALLDEPDLLPVDTHPATSTLYKVMYGDTKEYKIFFNPKVKPEDPSELEEVPPIVTTDPAELKRYGTHSKNSENAQDVARIEVYLPNDLLKSGVIINDTPGLGRICSEFDEIPFQQVITADAICFVVNPGISPATIANMCYLKKFLEIATHYQVRKPALCFVQTCIDLLSEEEVSTYQDRDLKTIQNSIGTYFSGPAEKIPYFPISSKRKEFANAASEEDSISYLEVSGFNPLLTFFENAFQEKREYLALELLEPIRFVTREVLQRGITNEQRLFDAVSDAKDKTDLNEHIRIMKEKLAIWEEDIFEPFVVNLDHKMRELQDDLDYRLQTELASDGNNPTISDMIAELKNRNATASIIRQDADYIGERCIYAWERIVQKSLEQYVEGMDAFFRENDDLLLSVWEDVSDLAPAEIELPSKKLQLSARDLFEEVMQIGRGAALVMTAFSLAELVLSGTAIASQVGSGTAIASQVGVAATGAAATGPAVLLVLAAIAAVAFITWRHYKKNELLGTYAELEEALNQMASSVYKKAARQSASLCNDCNKTVKDNLRKLKQTVRRKIEADCSAARQACDADADANRRISKTLKERATRVQELLDTLNKILEADTQTAAAPSR